MHTVMPLLLLLCMATRRLKTSDVICMWISSHYSMQTFLRAWLFALQQSGRACHHKSVFLIRFIAWESIKCIYTYWCPGLFLWYELSRDFFLSLIKFYFNILNTAGQMFTTFDVFCLWYLRELFFLGVCFSLSKAADVCVWKCSFAASVRCTAAASHTGARCKTNLLSVINILWRP